MLRFPEADALIPSPLFLGRSVANAVSTDDSDLGPGRLRGNRRIVTAAAARGQTSRPCVRRAS